MKEIGFLTKHGKRCAVEAPLAAAGYRVLTVDSIDTDRFGTFTGEIARHGTQLEAAVAKAKLGASAGCKRYGLGSEGSFGMDPHLGLVAWGREVLAWWDAELDYAVHAYVEGPETNYAQLTATTREEALSFASLAGFPGQGIVVRREGEGAGSPRYDKDCWSLTELAESVAQALRHGPVLLETDMRAHRNPLRMTMIRRAADALARRLQNVCPCCRSPGFGPTGFVPGAVCEECRAITDVPKARRLVCKVCDYASEEPIRHTVPPERCPSCNP